MLVCHVDFSNQEVSAENRSSMKALLHGMGKEKLNSINVLVRYSVVIRDVHHGSQILTFIHLGLNIATKEEGEKNLLSYLFCSLNFTIL